MQRNPNFGLDLVRTAAILLVLFSHTEHWWMGERAGVVAGYWGTAGVDLFFSLSGFLIGGILLRTQPRGWRGLARFWGRRWMRTLPAYWVVLMLLQAHFGTVAWRDYLFLQSFVPAPRWTPLMPHAWSLVLEEWFYLVAPALLAGLAALPALRRRGLVVPAGCALLIASGVGGRLWSKLHFGADWTPDLALNPLLRLDCAAWGLLAAWAMRGRRLAVWAAAALALAGAALIVVFSVVWLDIFYAPERLPFWGWAWWLTSWIALFPTALEGAAALVVVGLGRLLPSGGWARWPVHAVAALSYALYLVHVPVLFLLDAGGTQDRMAQMRAVVLVLAAAVALRLLVERPVLALRDRFLRDRFLQDRAGGVVG